MSDVEKVGTGDNASGKRERLTLSLGDKLKVPQPLTKASSTGKSFMTVEVRSKKRKMVGALTGRGEYPSSEDRRRAGASGKSGSVLTAQEQLFRISAINMADSISIREKEAAEQRAREEELAAAAAAREAAAAEAQQVRDAPVSVDAEPVREVEEVVSEAEAPAATSGKGGHDDRKKYSHGAPAAAGRHREKEKEGGVKKAASVRSSSKHVKLDIEDGLSVLEDKRVTRMSSSGGRRRGHNVKSNTRRLPRDVVVTDSMDVRSLSLAMAEKSQDVLRYLAQLGVESKINTDLTPELACEVATAFGHRPRIVSKVKMEQELSDIGAEGYEEQPRPPVVTVMGHVDHGKTSLLDVLRSSNVADKEVRGITQHIGAYQIDVEGKKITFLDTPGHEAFADMRARGANVTDIVVLVVAADDGIMPQTVESINHVKAAGVAMIVAVNKIDKSDANVDKITNDLLQHGVVSEELGGDVMVVPVSAKTGENIEKLKSTILLLAEMLELRAPVGCRARGVVIESRVDRGCGAIATVIVQQGTLRKGDVVVAGDSSYGKVRSMFDDADRVVDVALPATPVRVLGLGSVPKAGDILLAMQSEKHASDLLKHRAEINFARQSGAPRTFSGTVLPSMEGAAVEEVNMILKADVAGSIEAVAYAIAQIEHEEVKFNILHKEVGDITKSDVLLAEVSSAVILAFNVKVDAMARDLLRQKSSVDVRHYQVIYDLVDDMKSMVSGKLKPIVQEVQVGLLAVRQVFSAGKGGTVVGCYVSEGSVSRGAAIRVLRGETVVGEGSVRALRRFKEDVKEVNRGLECGLLVDGINGITAGDTIKILEVVEHVRTVE
ncbi:translation initiation factor IF-2 [Candidatus Anaplasma sp. TIGMIC]|uniref:translation initiation factor IF-2 n=1 Tax=Candidatus Anaplasma sp. TIGMIC TaxID=3020713 RepID=UPI00232AA0CF|nr:translation initiation factor IF-2 [Candidatus Anaplasma sp. TIGMIC]MDB1135165.1 translation initiation factor IF-2 [Candidatus Anaplasma sp. TIGMIC]